MQDRDSKRKGNTKRLAPPTPSQKEEKEKGKKEITHIYETGKRKKGHARMHACLWNINTRQK